MRAPHMKQRNEIPFPLFEQPIFELFYLRMGIGWIYAPFDSTQIQINPTRTGIMLFLTKRTN